MSQEFFCLYSNVDYPNESYVDLVCENNKVYKRYYSYMPINCEYKKNLMIDHIIIDEGCVMTYCDKDYTVFESTLDGTNKMFYLYNNYPSVEKVIYEEVEHINPSQYQETLEMDYMGYAQ
jgi:hypothetical protein